MSETPQVPGPFNPNYPPPVHAMEPERHAIHSVPRSTNGFAIAAMVLSLVGASILGVIFGHVALGQIKRNNQEGRGMALAGVILGWIGVVLYIVFIIAAVSATSDAVTDICNDYPNPDLCY